MKPEDEIQSIQSRLDAGSDAGLDPSVTAALRAVAEADGAAEAPLEVEARLRAAFRSRARSRRIRVWQWLPAAAAAVILVMVAGYYRVARVAPAHNVASRIPPARVHGPEIPIQNRGMEGAVDKSHVAARTPGKPNAARAPYAQPREIATDFFPLVDFAPPVDDGELVRVSLPASAMREVGLPVREDRMTDRVQADVIVSHGLATAIRFVK